MPKENYNPFLLTSKLSATEYMYERLMIVETYSCEEIPWLATGYEWTDPKTLVFDTRDGVKWTDGESFTAEDVAFTFNMLKEYPVLDLAGVWQYIELGRGHQRQPGHVLLQRARRLARSR